MKTLLCMFLFCVSCFSVDYSTVGEMNFKIGYKNANLQCITVDKVVRISSRTAFDEVSISSGYVVAVDTTPAYYWVNVYNLRMPLDDTRYADFKKIVIDFLTTQSINILFYHIEAHKCRWGSDTKCSEVQTWEK